MVLTTTTAGGEVLLQDGDPYRNDAPNTSRGTSTGIFVLEFHFGAAKLERGPASNYQSLTA